MADFEISYDRPIPDTKTTDKYRFGKMLIGGSIIVKPEHALTVNNAAYKFGKRNGMKFMRRGNIIWRVG